MNTTCMMKTVAMCVSLALLASAGSGCKSNKDSAVIDTGMNPSAIEDEGWYISCPDPPTLHFKRATDLTPVYFDYDVSTLRPDAMDTLARNAEVMKSKPANTYFCMEGNCDERGTQEYNLALGERRALAVRSYLISLGADGSKMITMSFGEENAVASGSSESAHAKDRRVDFAVATASP